MGREITRLFKFLPIREKERENWLLCGREGEMTRLGREREEKSIGRADNAAEWAELFLWFRCVGGWQDSINLIEVQSFGL